MVVCGEQHIEPRIRRLVLSGSPFADGKTEKVAQYYYKKAQNQGETAELLCVSQLAVAGCRGCNACARFLSDVSYSYQCIIQDDMQMAASKLIWCDELVVVAPVFFSGSPSQLKALYDRLQPFFWHRARGEKKRPFDLVVLGEGGDPYGYTAFVSEGQSALAMAGFKLRNVFDLVGRVAEDGTFDSSFLAGS